MSGIIKAPSPLSSKKAYKRKKKKKGKGLEEKYGTISVKHFISNFIKSGCRLLLRRRVEPLQNFTVFTIYHHLFLFIVVSQSRDTDHGVGSNSTPTWSITHI